MKGYMIGITELGIYFATSAIIRHHFTALKDINAISYYWFTMTVLTFIWEFAFIVDYNEVSQLGENLITNNETVWTNDYDITYIMPWKLSRIFYAEYGAHADREYLARNRDWSKTIESSHALFCGVFSLSALTLKIAKNLPSFYICLGISMGSQFMNSLLYMVNYWYQCEDPDNVNYITSSFPAGHWFGKRAFMYVNIFWMLMPSYTMIYYLFYNTNSNTYKKLDTNNYNYYNMKKI